MTQDWAIVSLVSEVSQPHRPLYLYYFCIKFYFLSWNTFYSLPLLPSLFTSPLIWQICHLVERIVWNIQMRFLVQAVFFVDYFIFVRPFWELIKPRAALKGRQCLRDMEAAMHKLYKIGEAFSQLERMRTGPLLFRKETQESLESGFALWIQRNAQA